MVVGLCEVRVKFSTRNRAEWRSKNSYGSVIDAIQLPYHNDRNLDLFFLVYLFSDCFRMAQFETHAWLRTHGSDLVRLLDERPKPRSRFGIERS